MRLRLGPYSEYKDSELPWLQRIPENWGLIRNRALIRRRKVLVGETHQNYQLLSLTKLGVIVRDVATGKGKFSSDMGTSQEVRKGDLVFCLFDVPETPRTVGLSNHAGMITGAYTVFECLNSAGAEYFELFYRAMDDRKLLSPLYSGLRNTIPPSRFMGTKTPQPPAEERASIVRFLKQSNKRIGRIVSIKNRLIALLNEQKQAIVQRAVTRGLDPKVRLKRSGVDWIGEMPEHWEVVRVKYLLKEVDERSTTGQEQLLSLRMNHGVVLHGEHFKRPGQASSLVGYKLVRPGQVVMNRLQANNGLTFSSEIFGAISPDYAIFKPIADLDTNYLTTLFRTPRMKHKFRVEAKGLGTGTSGFLRLYSDRFGTIPVALPPRKEQTEIMIALQDALGSNQRNTMRVQSEVNLLLEYRTRLIADVVTGKLDVREVELPEMEELEKLDALDPTGDIEADALDGTEDFVYADD